VEAVKAAAATRGIELHVLDARNESDFNAAFAALPSVGAGALMIGSDPFFNSRVERLVALALRHRMPTIYPFREYAMAGGLLSYGDSITGPYRVAGAYVGRIVGGEKPSDLPVQQSTKVELVVNLKTANALGFSVPLALLVRADEVIE
jgi:putative tryptophan/tyrosine transport system substrate-binding protein